jgi:hypothetical protein
MTDVATATCATCGAEIFGTKFCESCGAAVDTQPATTREPATAATVAVDATPPGSPAAAPAPFVYPAATASTSRPGTGPRVAVLVLLLIGTLLPWLVTLAEQGGANPGYTLITLEITEVVLVVILMIAAAAIGPASQGAKAGAIVCALLYLILALIIGFASLQVAEAGPAVSFIVGGLEDLALFFAWSLGRPFRGPGYVGLIPLVIGIIIQDYLASQVVNYFTLGGATYTFLIALSELASILVVIGLSALPERDTGRSVSS